VPLIGCVRIGSVCRLKKGEQFGSQFKLKNEPINELKKKRCERVLIKTFIKQLVFPNFCK
jgi:hypothetical protein